MRVAQRFAGYSLEEADNLRKACGQEDPRHHRRGAGEVRRRLRAQGYGETLGTAAVRHHRALRRLRLQQVPLLRLRPRRLSDGVAEGEPPRRVPGRLLTSVKDDKDKTAVYLAECRTLGIEVLVPDVNRRSESRRLHRRTGTAAPTATAGRSSSGWPRFATSARAWSRRIVAERERAGPFVDFYDFCQRVDPSVLNKRTIESLIKAGRFDSLGHPRQGLCLVFEEIVDRTLERRREQEPVSSTLFASLASPRRRQATGFADTRVPIPDTEFDKSQRLAFEKEMLGLYISDHPLMGLEGSLARLTDCTLAELRDTDPDAAGAVAGAMAGGGSAARARPAWSVVWSPSWPAAIRRRAT